MKSGVPAFGRPEYVAATQITGQMARYYNLPPGHLMHAANAPDGQVMWKVRNGGPQQLRVKIEFITVQVIGGWINSF